MPGGRPSESSLGRLHLACGRVAAIAGAIAEAYNFQVAEGSHPEPWSEAYCHEAVWVYAESLPAVYQERVGVLFVHASEAMNGFDVPAGRFEDWAVVWSYLRHTSRAIDGWLTEVGTARSRELEQPAVPIEDEPPRVIRYDRLAALTTLDGALRLKRAATAVRDKAPAPSTASLDATQCKLLNMLAEGTSVADMASVLAYSERSIYRALDRLYRQLGVAGRIQAVRKAATSGLLKD